MAFNQYKGRWSEEFFPSEERERERELLVHRACRDTLHITSPGGWNVGHTGLKQATQRSACSLESNIENGKTMGSIKNV